MFSFNFLVTRLYRPNAALRLRLRLFGDGVMGDIVSVSSCLSGDGVMGGIVSVSSGLFGDGVMGGIVSVLSGLFGDGVMGGIVFVLSGEYSLFVCMFASNLRSVFSHLMRKCRY